MWVWPFVYTTGEDWHISFNRTPEACAKARDAHASGLRLNESISTGNGSALPSGGSFATKTA